MPKSYLIQETYSKSLKTCIKKSIGCLIPLTIFQPNAPKELVREYQTPEGEKVREVGPIVYGYSMTIGPDGKPHVREFGNVKSLGG